METLRMTQTLTWLIPHSCYLTSSHFTIILHILPEFPPPPILLPYLTPPTPILFYFFFSLSLSPFRNRRTPNPLPFYHPSPFLKPAYPSIISLPILTEMFLLTLRLDNDQSSYNLTSKYFSTFHATLFLPPSTLLNTQKCFSSHWTRFKPPTDTYF